MINLKEFLNLNYYTSELDQFLKAFDQSHPVLSPSQQQEREKYRNIYKLRDQKQQIEIKQTFWDHF